MSAHLRKAAEDILLLRRHQELRSQPSNLNPLWKGPRLSIKQ